MRVGWVGLGMVGTAMVERLLNAGHVVTVFARGKGLEAVLRAGARSTSSYLEIANSSEALGLCLFDDDQVEDVLFAQGMLAAMPRGSTLFIHTTGSPDTAREIGARAPDGVDVLDATFSGGIVEAEAGRLVVMVGGAADALGRVDGIFGCYADRIFHVGALGHGQLVKLLNNLIFATNLKNAAELLRLAEGFGFASTDTAAIIQACSGASFAMRLLERRPITEALDTSGRYARKDVAEALRAAEDAGLATASFRDVKRYFD